MDEKPFIARNNHTFDAVNTDFVEYFYSFIKKHLPKLDSEFVSEMVGNELAQYNINSNSDTMHEHIVKILNKHNGVKSEDEDCITVGNETFTTEKLYKMSPTALQKICKKEYGVTGGRTRKAIIKTLEEKAK